MVGGHNKYLSRNIGWYVFFFGTRVRVKDLFYYLGTSTL